MDPQQGPPQPDLLIGQTIGNYLVTQKLGEGGMGSVYLAEHPSIGKKVALKVLHPEFSTNQEVTARFFHEAKAVNDIGHPNIVDIVDFGVIQAGTGREQLVYFIMEYLGGVTLSQLIRGEAPLPPERALSIALQVADALSASHRCGIVHRDLKPDNVILMQRGRERDFVKLLDFGIAKLTGGAAAGSHRTQTGIVMGTPAYMSPEQCEGRDTVDLRTDVYALGIVLYEMLTGRVPFVGESYREILLQHLTQRPARPSQFRMLPAHVEVMVLKALEKRADLRYPTMEEFMRAMSDPVGYVEVNGGVGGFLQRPLMPSNAPLPSVRLTPAPLTPLPGTVIAPSGPAIAMPAPTTRGSAASQVQASRGRVGYILAGLVIVAAAAALIIVLVGKDKVQPAGGGPIASDDHGRAAAGGPGGAVMPGSAMAGPGDGATGSGGEPIAAGGAPAGPGDGEAGSGAANPGSAASSDGAGGSTGGPPGGSASGPQSESTGSAAGAEGAGGSTGGSQSGSTASAGGAQAGSRAGSAPSGPAIAGDPTSEILVSSTPRGARIYLDDVDTGKSTPATLQVAKKKKSVSLTLKLKGYDPFTLKPVDVREDSHQEAELKIKTASGVTARCRTPERPKCARDSKGCCLPESSRSGGGHTGSGGRAGSAVTDPDGLMKP